MASNTMSVALGTSSVVLFLLGTGVLFSSSNGQPTTHLSVATSTLQSTTAQAAGARILPTTRHSQQAPSTTSQSRFHQQAGHRFATVDTPALDLTSHQSFVSALSTAFWAAPVVMVISWLMHRRSSKAIAMATVTSTPTVTDDKYSFAALKEEVPKGTRKLVNINGANILIFWYRNELFAIENRSPAEGAFNQGFETARFTQDFGILCPSTESEFSLRNGEVQNWLPNNSVLRFLTPPCPPLEVFPVKVEDGEVKVAVPEAQRDYFDGGATSSFERNNVFGIEPRMYLEDGTYVDESGNTKTKVDPATIVISTVAVAVIAVAGTATCLYLESIPALAAFWLVGFGITAKTVWDYTQEEQN
uniref:Rieske domain-containing protein n=1 Tax=Eutreptiella gymnastica TaxID=73025 RepID=A0A6U7XK26_9EUGL|mmetsp:Transcript_140927/g.245597  ORF Transcript_140927/g.245597 Transcript_140927/m.245597 type:complete len:360 (+) Transcript_140927:101-1180(+)